MPPTPNRSDLGYDDDCAICGHRLGSHPKTLVELPEPWPRGQYEWRWRLCNGEIADFNPPLVMAVAGTRNQH